jgi:tRNA U34 5-methylaminomethyl-2-thiouridine-forming methyltransferase MnmC
MLSILKTKDGSDTLLNEVINSTYHSLNGAIQESVHIFIKAGLHSFMPFKKEIKVLEVGFGTGLNAWLTYLETVKNPNLRVNYIALEPFPLEEFLLFKLNYTVLEMVDNAMSFIEFHKSIIQNKHIPNFRIKVLNDELIRFSSKSEFNIVYYDAFGPKEQPEMWTKESINKSTDFLVDGGVWVSYCAKGDVRRNLEDNGLKVERREGPPGKRHMLWAIKND